LAEWYDSLLWRIAYEGSSKTDRKGSERKAD
jgi:hypothetical protein